MEDDGKLYHDALPLKNKSKFFTLVPYKEMGKFKDDNLTPIRPCTNVNHSQYLINLFSEINDCESLFEYKNMEDNESLLEGTMKLTYGKEVKKIHFYGVKNLNTLMVGVLCKMVLPKDVFKKNIGNILKLDQKITDSKRKE